ncbi:GntR family transcriptional regulator [Calidifontibacter indicus]|uniref:GntR family transcriptional regulator n=1 Tax=Calidifontibacter indicus TaxID=419650 RepID=A0A3D9USQ3_9MICO|nr:GntR family transcriptional regulator [Calidifontibacter indicus]REF29675.1 GntR family transcriptional regulator [Calidifontibacter indicus]
MSAPSGRAADRAHAYLREEILQGRITPGTMLSESELGARLSMSRTPIRAALTRLQDEGWVTIYPQRGALVREVSEQEVWESAVVRHALESAGVQRSTASLRAPLEESLKANLAAQRDARADNDFGAFTTLAMRFHRGFVEMAGNAVMLSVYDRLQDQQALSIVRSSGTITGDPEQVLGEHRRLLDDALRGDWVAFSTHLDDHQTRSHGLETGSVRRG